MAESDTPAMNRRLAAALGLIALASIGAAPPKPDLPPGAGAGAAPVARCGTDLVRLNHVTGWQVEWLQRMSGSSRPDRAELLKRADWLDAETQALRSSVAGGRLAPAAVVERVIVQLDALQQALSGVDAPSDAPARDRLGASLAVYRTVLAGPYLDRARRITGLASLPGGSDCFRQAAQWWTAMDADADALEGRGRRLIESIRSDLARAAGIRESEVPALLERMRQERLPTGRNEVVRLTRDAIDRARQVLPRIVPEESIAPLAVEALPPALEAGAPAAFYRAANAAGPPAVVVNASRPDERRRMLEAIAFHEGIPGHHLQAALARSPGFNAAFLEGWGIYAEYLAAEFRLYSGRDDLIGMHAKHLWAAARLIVEPGLHVHGWSRAQAIDFMRANTALSDEEIATEVDRYLALPGQSLSYMLGADRLRGIRARAECAMGPRFDLRAFHAAVLAPGPRPLDQVEKDVGAWVQGIAPSAGRPDRWDRCAGGGGQR